MKNGNNSTKTYKVLCILANGEVSKDYKSFKSEEGALRRLQQLVQFEELQIECGQGIAHDYRIAVQA